MILNVVLKMILRSWWRNKVFFLVSVASLALGLACTNLLMTYFVHEHGLEGRNPDRDRMFFLRQDDPMTYGAQNETYIEGWEKKTSNLLIYKRLCKI